MGIIMNVIMKLNSVVDWFGKLVNIPKRLRGFLIYLVIMFFGFWVASRFHPEYCQIWAGISWCISSTVFALGYVMASDDIQLHYDRCVKTRRKKVNKAITSSYWALSTVIGSFCVTTIAIIQNCESFFSGGVSISFVVLIWAICFLFWLKNMRKLLEHLDGIGD